MSGECWIQDYLKEQWNGWAEERQEYQRRAGKGVIKAISEGNFTGGSIITASH